MKKAYLADVIKKHGRRIRRYGKQLPGSFDPEMVHDLRVEYKKLRAFIRLLQEGKKGKDLDMPADIKNMYHAAGRVRDLQLFVPQVADREALNGIVLGEYSAYLQQRLFRAKESLVRVIEHMHAGKGVEQLTRALPASLDDKVIRRFIHRKIASVHVILLALEQDRELHSIRKQLKDILLNIRLFDSDWGISFPVTAWRSEKKLTDVAALLGDYNDRCRALSFLSESMIYTLPDVEKDLLRAWRADLSFEKGVIRQQVGEQLSQLQLVANFERQL
ncbi:CHAD domain-containing protein [Paraflavitalea pollutisoli]|uniref:CHAD domain-containing protein n=1 Tax=Paraflavitalea pollutisoli TaxID=3034143 RepID=UPI0023ED12CD|nr:CHAD domain-containing protein [Paraflavitalea sp. H1-2-19X]